MEKAFPHSDNGARSNGSTTNVRLNSAVGYITPKDMLGGRQAEIHAERDQKLEEAGKQRQIRRQQAV
jgi:putative transposase